MAYTVKQLAQLSGVSVRTLHWYDEKGLLKPDHLGANGYRYYEEEQLLMLQQILFFRELGFALNDIQDLLAQDAFDKVKALQSHKQILSKEINRKQALLETIDQTILRLRGKIVMSNKALFKGFDPARQEEYEQYLVKEYGLEAETRLKESRRRTAKWDKDEWDEVKSTGDAIHKALAEAIERGMEPESDAVQAIIEQHFQFQNRFYEVTKGVYIGLTELYSGHPDFKKFFDVYHPDMIDYLSRAMRYYAEENL